MRDFVLDVEEEEIDGNFLGFSCFIWRVGARAGAGFAFTGLIVSWPSEVLILLSLFLMVGTLETEVLLIEVSFLCDEIKSLIRLLCLLVFESSMLSLS